MALSFTRRRVREANPNSVAEEIKSLSTLSNQNQKHWCHLSSALLLGLLIAFCCTSTLLTESGFHICISSRKLSVYCISSGARIDLSRNTYYHIDSVHAIISNNINTTKTLDVKVVAVRAVEGKMRRMRQLVNNSTNSKSCEGRGIYVYELPSKFNSELINYCHDFLPWTDMCEYFANDALGNPIPSLGDGWYDTHQYLLEPIFHKKVLKHACRVYDPDKAVLFYVPFYGGLDILRLNFKNVSHEIKDSLSLELLQWVRNQSSWTRNEGHDHLFVLGKITWDFRRRPDSNWGSTMLKHDVMRNPYKFLIERQPWEDTEIGVPHPTHFHPHSDADIVSWQSKVMSTHRKNLVGFAGSAKPGAAGTVRAVLIDDCKLDSQHCKFLNCSSDGCRNPETVIGLFMDSEFCLQPVGDSPTRKSVFDGMIAGCIPVLFDPFTAYYQYPWHLPEDHRRYSVFIDEEDVGLRKVDVMEKLKNITKKERDDMRACIVYELLPGLVYGDTTSEFSMFRDAFDVAINNLLEIMSAKRKQLESIKLR